MNIGFDWIIVAMRGLFICDMRYWTANLCCICGEFAFIRLAATFDAALLAETEEETLYPVEALFLAGRCAELPPPRLCLPAPAEEGC